MILAGRLRRRIVIEQVTEVRDGIGGVTETWTTLATVWAAIEALSGREYVQAQQLQAEVDHVIRIRYRDGVKPKMRVKDGARIFDIQAVLDPEAGRRRELVLMAKEAA